MERYFHETIESWNDWGRVFQSIPAFEPLVREIFRREGLPCGQVEHLTPGTNAVFRAGAFVVKVFFPRESGLDPLPDFQNEAAVCGWLTRRSLPAPRLIARGVVEDKYRFHYLITEYFRGKEAGDWLSAASREEKRSFVRQLQALLEQLNRPADGLIPPIDLRKRAVENARLEKLPPALAREMRERAASLSLTPAVLVHGDLTGENLLVDETGRIVIIDCADACLAPAWYELGPLVFELFRCDPFLLKLLAGDGREAFAQRVLDAACLHDFGADLLREAAARAGRPPFSGLAEVRKFLLERV